jgi:hypothetical protein
VVADQLGLTGGAQLIFFKNTRKTSIQFAICDGCAQGQHCTEVQGIPFSKLDRKSQKHIKADNPTRHLLNFFGQV